MEAYKLNRSIQRGHSTRNNEVDNEEETPSNNQRRTIRQTGRALR